MVNTEHTVGTTDISTNYNILNIVVNTEPRFNLINANNHYNILNIVVNTEQSLLVLLIS